MRWTAKKRPGSGDSLVAGRCASACSAGRGSGCVDWRATLGAAVLACPKVVAAAFTFSVQSPRPPPITAEPQRDPNRRYRGCCARHCNDWSSDDGHRPYPAPPEPKDGIASVRRYDSAVPNYSQIPSSQQARCVPVPALRHPSPLLVNHTEDHELAVRRCRLVQSGIVMIRNDVESRIASSPHRDRRCEREQGHRGPGCEQAAHGEEDGHGKHRDDRSADHQANQAAFSVRGNVELVVLTEKWENRRDDRCASLHGVIVPRGRSHHECHAPASSPPSTGLRQSMQLGGRGSRRAGNLQKTRLGRSLALPSGCLYGTGVFLAPCVGSGSKENDRGSIS
jgi:hypothetical protein